MGGGNTGGGNMGGNGNNGGGGPNGASGMSSLYFLTTPMSLTGRSLEE